MTLTSNPRRARVMTHTHTKTPIERSVGSKDGLETNGHAGGRLAAANAVGKCLQLQSAFDSVHAQAGNGHPCHRVTCCPADIIYQSHHGSNTRPKCCCCCCCCCDAGFDALAASLIHEKRRRSCRPSEQLAPTNGTARRHVEACISAS